MSSQGFTIRVPILVYHQIESTENVSSATPGLVVDTRTFRRHVSLLKMFGFTSLNLDDLVSALDGSKVLPRRPVVLTFDDGYAGVYENAFPILSSQGFTATMYCIAEDFAKGGSASVKRAFPVMSHSQLAEMLKSGFTMGSHSLTHPDLTVIPNTRAKEEVASSRKLLEDFFGTSVTTFAYPYGRFGPRIQEMVRQAGYRSAVTTERGSDHSSGQKFRLHRIPIGLQQHTLGFLVRLSGSRML
jgi:peptidoglycan/xylan/chitin deacetylase (PgdA/CDA1 family)